MTISLRPLSLLLHLITITIKNTITTQINRTLLTNRGIGGKDEITIVLAAEMGDQGWSGRWDTIGFHTHFLFQLRYVGCISFPQCSQTKPGDSVPFPHLGHLNTGSPNLGGTTIQSFPRYLCFIFFFTSFLELAMDKTVRKYCS